MVKGYCAVPSGAGLSGHNGVADAGRRVKSSHVN